MDLERITAAIRPRLPWESVDLGFRMVLTRGRLIYLTWFIVTLPVFVVLMALCIAADIAAFGAALFWWFKPLYDRVVLHILSRSLFGDEPGILDVARRAPRLFFSAGALRALTLLRLDPARSFNLPVWQLENLRGAELKRRTQVLHGKTWGIAALLTAVCASLEWVFVLSIYAFFALLVPPEMLPELGARIFFEFEGGGTLAGQLVQAAVYYLVVMLVEPLYVGGGFALYLNRRTVLEAWDIELAFRRLVARRRKGSPSALTAATLVIALGLVVTHSPGVYAADAERNARAANEIEIILQQPEFEAWETRRVWQPRFDTDENSEDDSSALRLGDGLLRLFSLASEVAVWALVMALALFLWFRRNELVAYFQPAPKREKTLAPASVHTPQPVVRVLPQDVPGAVRELWRSGQQAAAVSLLYRAALHQFRHRHHLQLDDSATEGDWLQAARSLASNPGVTFFQTITRTWQYTAYASQPPSDEAIDALLAQWAEHFGDQP